MARETLWAGTHQAITWEVKNDDGSVRDLSGFTAQFEYRLNGGTSQTQALSVDASAGTVTWDPTNAWTAGTMTGRAYVIRNSDSKKFPVGESEDVFDIRSSP